LVVVLLSAIRFCHRMLSCHVTINALSSGRFRQSQFVRSIHKRFELCEVNKHMIFLLVRLTNSTIRNL